MREPVEPVARDRPPVLHRLVREQAARAPESIAVVFGAERLTYGRFAERSGSWAAHLRGMGVDVGARVGIHLDLSLELPLIVHAVLEAGGICIPLPPTHPSRSLEAILGAASPSVVVTQGGLRSELPATSAAVIAADEITPERRAAPDARVCGSDLAIVNFTSGSTGTPKGVMVPHAALSARLLSTERRSSDPSRCSVMKTSVNLAPFLGELFGPLLAGHRFVVADPRHVRDIEYLGSLVVEHGVTHVAFTPAQLRAFVDWPGADRCTSLQVVYCGGEAVANDLPARFFARLTDTRLLVAYGTTEAGHVTSLECHAGDRLVGRPIGRPTPEASVRVLDARAEPVAAGAWGEICLGGPRLALGYLGEPAATAERFVPHPDPAVPGERLHRSGDRGRLLPDGRIEFKGRIDHQVKISGFRVELGEIEAALGRHDSIRQAVAVLHDSGEGHARLVAYAVPADGVPVRAAEVQAFLRQHLPEYVAPAIVFLDELPLTPNGKIDRAALPGPGVGDRGEFVGARNGREEVLCAIWCDVLGLPRVSVHDDFFSLGGHSLVATRLVARIASTLDVELPLREVFDHPTIAGLAQRLRSAGGGRGAPALRRVERRDGLPLSFAQERLWFLDQMGAGAAYNIGLALALRGDLDRASLSRALAEIVRRHEALRTSFPAVDGKPVQRIADASGVALTEIDASGLAAAERDAEVRRLVQREAEQPFDLATGPPMRATLVETSRTEHVLLLTAHHIVADGWSTGVLFDELAASYEAYAGGRESPLEELDVQYADFAAWQRRWLSAGALEEQLAYWRRQLCGVPVLDLPTDRRRPSVQTFRGAAHAFEIPAELTASLAELSRREGVTLAMVTLAAWQALLSRYTGQHDVAVGSPIAGRGRAELEPMIGFFVNTLVMRTGLGSDPTVTELLRRVREVSLSAYDHQDVPFEQLVEDLNPDRDMSRTPLFQVMFSMQNSPREALRLGGLEVRMLPAALVRARVDLELHFFEHRGRLPGRLIYNVDLFDAVTIERMAERLVRLLQAMASDPARRVAEIDLLDDRERHRLLVAWNDTAAAQAADTCVHGLVEQQAARTPDAVAVIGGEERVSYAELNARADRLARRLAAEGVGASDAVGLCVGRSPDMVIGMLGILKAGAAYVPLDPEYPPERLRFMLSSCGARVVVADVDLSPVVPGDVRVVAPGGHPAGPAAGRAATVGPSHPAYVLFTSGSTGRPKGLVMHHGALVNLVEWQARVSPPGSADRTIQFGTVSFDQHFLDVFATWSAGGAVVLVSDEVRRDPVRLIELMNENGVTRAFMPYVAVRQLAEAARRAGRVPASLRLLVTAGEALRVTSAMRWFFERLPRCVLCNQYGPAETNVATALDLLPPAAEWPAVPSIGRGIANTRVYVLDERGAPVPPGTVGELYIGGAAVGLGYVGAPALTAERFVPDPFGAEPGARLYGTGDLARHRRDGTLEFLGRVDDQVKVRGYRIEPGEIEVTLLRSDRVREAVVVLRDDPPGGERLVAYVVPERADDRDAGDLRPWLSRQLPGYMVPAAIVALESMPLNPNGKVDRRALPAPSDRPAADYVAPRDETEAELAAIWGELLGVDRVGVLDDFFDLGGHSLLAVRVTSRVRDRLGIELPLQSLFESPTIAGQREHVDLLRWARGDAGPPPEDGDDEEYEF